MNTTEMTIGKHFKTERSESSILLEGFHHNTPRSSLS